MSRLADDEKLELWRKHGQPLCDNMATSLKKKSKTGYKHVSFSRQRGNYRAHVYDIEARKNVSLVRIVVVPHVLCFLRSEQPDECEHEQPQRSACRGGDGCRRDGECGAAHRHRTAVLLKQVGAEGATVGLDRGKQRRPGARALALHEVVSKQVRDSIR